MVIRLHTLLLFSSLFIFSFQSMAQLHGIHPSWYQTPKSAVTNTQPNLQGAVANNMVVKSDGTVIFFYRQSGQNKWIASSDNGNSWYNPGNLPASAVTAAGTISADISTSDIISIAWKSGSYGISTANYSGGQWSAPVTINTSTTTTNDTVGFLQLSVDRKNRIHIMWQQGNHNNFQITASCWHSRSVNGGTSFSSPSRISGTLAGDAAFPVADFSGTTSDTLLIAWRQNIPGIPDPAVMNWDVYGSVSTNGGETWQTPFPIANAASPNHEWDPNVIVDRNGFFHVFYHEYHSNITGNDKTANIHYRYSFDGGTTWSSSHVLSENNIRSHLIKTAYDYTNNYVWCGWKDERDKQNNNPRADIMVVGIKNTGTPLIGTNEFISDHDTTELAYHNFKVGKDGILRGVFNNSKNGGNGDTIFYNQRATITTGNIETTAPVKKIAVFPNPSPGILYIDGSTNNNREITIYNIIGQEVYSQNLTDSYIDLSRLEKGVYFISIKEGAVRTIQKFIKK